MQGGSVLKPLVGAANDGPGDAAVLRPVLGSRRGIVVSCGMNPHYGDFDTYWMAASAIDEAVRNCVAVGADPARIAILDNFCWGSTDRPETLGSLVRAALACHDVAVALGTPFISGKDSLNNEFHAHQSRDENKVGGPLPATPSASATPQTADPVVAISIPPSLLISALGQVDDVARCVSMDLKEPGNLLYLVGLTKNELGGSHFALVEGLSGGEVPRVDAPTAKKCFAAMHQAIDGGLIRACHDLSEGGLAVAAAEMAFAGARRNNRSLRRALSPVARRRGSNRGSSAPSPFCSANRILASFARSAPKTRPFLSGPSAPYPTLLSAKSLNDGHLRIADVAGTAVVEANLKSLKAAWQQPLRW